VLGDPAVADQACDIVSEIHRLNSSNSVFSLTFLAVAPCVSTVFVLFARQAAHVASSHQRCRTRSDGNFTSPDETKLHKLNIQDPKAIVSLALPNTVSVDLESVNLDNDTC
jgi:hypothetical protein